MCKKIAHFYSNFRFFRTSKFVNKNDECNMSLNRFSTCEPEQTMYEFTRFARDVYDEAVWRWHLVDPTTQLIILMCSVILIGFWIIYIGVQFHRIVSPKNFNVVAPVGANNYNRVLPVGNEPQFHALPDPPPVFVDRAAPPPPSMPRLIKDRMAAFREQKTANDGLWKSKHDDKFSAIIKCSNRREKGQMTKELWNSIYSSSSSL